MIHFDLPKEKSSIIKVIGVGGGGGNAVNHMFSQNIDGVNFIICNTDAQALANSGIPNRVQLGPHLTQGLGAGANPEIGRQATEESLEELKGILEVNTKMAFITAGMGGGTGTGGAPIIAKICKDLGILTVGIVTMPFSYEGKKRQIQAEEGIKTLKSYVDTLLVISNDKLRHQFGNLKMREAFERADNVLATAAKCITDVINSTGQINVDFADVCTVMKNGGVAILGSSAVAGEDRAHLAIEQALNSPLLNDNEIRGAKWILININSAEGEHEFTMDEVEVIQAHLLTEAGEGTDVILGLGYDNSLGDKIGITLIATGFEHKEMFNKPVLPKEEPKKEEKIVMVLGQPVTPPKPKVQQASAFPMDPLAPKLVDENVVVSPMPSVQDMPVAEEEGAVHFSLGNQDYDDDQVKSPGKNTVGFTSETTVNNLIVSNNHDTVNSLSQHQNPSSVSATTGSVHETVSSTPLQFQQTIKDSNAPLPAASGGYLARPSNIYAEVKAEAQAPAPSSVEKPVPPPSVAAKSEDEPSELQMQLVEKDDIPAADKPLAHQAQPPLSPGAEDLAMHDEAEDQKRRASDRLHKLRNLSFNVNGNDPNNEFENVPAYIRRNMELYNSSSHIENFYSSYEVKTDKNNKTQISTINTFLEGKKPD
ncbi:MAG: cell division protein FtsZ [Chitinophagaceae bacterium]|nr:MAG: cell division protein FtsZ [Chitinophagaceae bacterium]